MTKSNDTHEDVYSQIMKVKKYVSALQDVYENMPDTDRYSSVISILCEGLEKEVEPLYSIALKGLK